MIHGRWIQKYKKMVLTNSAMKVRLIKINASDIHCLCTHFLHTRVKYMSD